MVTTDIAGAATAAARRAVDLPIEVRASSDGTSVTVSVTYVDPTDVTIIGRFIGPITHRASVTMVLEPVTSLITAAASPCADGKMSR